MITVRKEVHHYHHYDHLLERFLMTISAAVQKVIDDIAANTSLAQSQIQASALLASQITNLQSQIAALQAQIAAGQSIGPEDLTALAQGASDLEATNAKLTAAQPANTTASPMVPAS